MALTPSVEFAAASLGATLAVVGLLLVTVLPSCGSPHVLDLGRLATKVKMAMAETM